MCVYANQRFPAATMLALACVLVALSGCTSGPFGSSTGQKMGTCYSNCDSGPATDYGASLPPAPLAPQVTYLGTISHPSMRTPTRIAVAPNNNIVVTDNRARRVHVFHASGQYRFPIGRARRPLGCAVDGQGRIYIGDTLSRSVLIFDSMGNYIRALGQGNNEFVMPSDIAVDRASEIIYVVDSKTDRIRAFKPDGSEVLAFGSTGNGQGQFDFPSGIAFEPESARLFVVDNNNARIQVFDGSGTFGSAFGGYGGGDGAFTRPQGLAVDARRRVYVADALQGRVQVVDTYGRHLAYIGTPGWGRDKMLLPLDAALDGYSRLLVTSHDSGRVQVFGIDGYKKPPPLVIEASAKMDPPWINPESKRHRVAVFLDLPAVEMPKIVTPTVRLHVSQAALVPVKIPPAEDQDDDGIPDAIFMFSHKEILDAFPTGSACRACLTGMLGSGERFEGWLDLSLKPSPTKGAQP